MAKEFGGYYVIIDQKSFYCMIGVLERSDVGDLGSSSLDKRYLQYETIQYLLYSVQQYLSIPKYDDGNWDCTGQVTEPLVPRY